MRCIRNSMAYTQTLVASLKKRYDRKNTTYCVLTALAKKHNLYTKK